jgi:hypothetical protein
MSNQMLAAARFSKDYPVACAQGRYGELIVVQGNGVRPARWTGAIGATATDAGIDPPDPPDAETGDRGNPSLSITQVTPPRYYVARVDVTRPGAVYHKPPAVTLNTSTTPPTGHKAAVVSTYLAGASVSEARVVSGGKYYPETPTVSLSSTPLAYGDGALLRAVLDGAPTEWPADSNPFTGITEWKITQAPDYLDPGGYDDGLTWYKCGNGSVVWTANEGSTTYNYGSWYSPSLVSYSSGLIVTITRSGTTPTSPATFRVTFGGAVSTYVPPAAGSAPGTPGFVLAVGARQFVAVTPVTYGAGYDATSVVTVTIAAGSGDSSRRIKLEGYPTGNAQNTAAARYSIQSIEFFKKDTGGRLDYNADGTKNAAFVPPGEIQKGSNYVVAPYLKVSSNSGFGAYATCTVAQGKLNAVTLENGGGGYKTPPTVTAVSGGAEAAVVARPHMRGKYQCYYRYIDDTPEDRGGPIPSSLSLVVEADAGEGCQCLTWSFIGPDGQRQKKIELWRSTSNEATTLYRVTETDSTSFSDDLTDEELRDPDRLHYAAMPIVLPNGELNANRFTPPPSDKAVVVSFQDRFWYGVDTSGKEPNTVYYSEANEPESVPDINELIIQQNSRGADRITALVPFGSTMLVMQQRHCFSLTYAQQPVIDAQVFPVGYRGCLNQRCWDIHDGICYVLDQAGVYAVTAEGSIDDLSAPIANLFRNDIDTAHVTWCFVSVDCKQKVVRAFVAFTSDASDGFPTRALCYGIESKTWWMERYPQRISCSTQAQLASGDYRSLYGAEKDVYLLSDGYIDDAVGAVTKVTVTNAGAGYVRPPKAKITGAGCGVELETVLTGDGRVAAVLVLSGGRNYQATGTVTIDAPPSGTGAVAATATFAATTTSSVTAHCPTYRFKTGSYEIPTDAQDKSGGTAKPRDVSLLYRPQLSKCLVGLRLYYNGSPYARPAVARRDRGVGFVSSAVDGAHRLDMGYSSGKGRPDSGVAKAMLAGRSMDDIQESDRHVAIELLGARVAEDPVVFHRLDVYGAGGK